MQITVYSFFTAVFWTSILTLILYILRKRPAFIKRFGVFSVGLIYLFCMGRMLLPIELDVTSVVPVTFFLNPMTKSFQLQLMKIGGQTVTLFGFLVFVWIAVSLVLIFLFVWNYLISRRHFSRIAKIDDIALQDMLRRVKRDTGRHINVRVSYAASISSPAGIGIFNKRIILPHRNYTDEELYLILLHEYTHFIHHDLAVTMMVQLFSYVFWWNPAVYLLKKDLEQVLEIKCDLSVVAAMNAAEKAQYLRVILLHMKHSEAKIIPFPTGQVSLLGHKPKSHIEERFRYVQQSSKRTNCPALQACFLAAAVFLFGISYCFVFQSQFEAPMEEIVTTSDAYEIKEDEITIHKRADGRYEFIEPHGVIEIDEDIALLLIEQGVKFIQE